jgi:hypothetical protein
MKKKMYSAIPFFANKHFVSILTNTYTHRAVSGSFYIRLPANRTRRVERRFMFSLYNVKKKKLILLEYFDNKMSFVRKCLIKRQ